MPVPDVVLASAVRTPIGRFHGALKDLSAPRLGALVVREACLRAGVADQEVEEVLMGCVLQAGLGQNPARQAALGAGLPVTIPAVTINKVCGSGLKAVMLAAQAIKAGDAKLLVAGGMESMTNAPYLLPGARSGLRLGDAPLLDSMVHDGLTDVYEKVHMGVTGDEVAREFRIDRASADRFALGSHRKAAAATDAGRFRDEILPVAVEAAGGAGRLDRDEGIRRDTSAEKLARLPPYFAKDGVTTAGNSSQLSDGAAALVVMSGDEARRRGVAPLGRVVAYGVSGVEPRRVMAAPIPGVHALLARTGLAIDDIDLFEHNEAFASASCAVRQECKVPEDRFNVHGGAVALGHPIGASGARVLTTLLYALKTHGKRRGLATLCLGGGNAVQMIVERP